MIFFGCLALEDSALAEKTVEVREVQMQRMGHHGSDVRATDDEHALSAPCEQSQPKSSRGV